MTPDERIREALDLAGSYGNIDGGHHKMWVIDQMVRVLTDCPLVPVHVPSMHSLPAYDYEALGESDEYAAWVAAHNDGEDGPDTYSWDTGIAP